MRKLVYLIVFVTTIGVAGLAFVQTDDTNNTHNAGNSGTTGLSGATGNPINNPSTSSSSMRTAGTHFVVGTVAGIDLGTSTIVLADVKPEAVTSSSSSNRYNNSGSMSSDHTGTSTRPEASTGSTSGGNSGSTGSTSDSTNSLNTISYLFSPETSFKGTSNETAKSTDIKPGDVVRVELDSVDLVQSITIISKASGN